MKTDRTIAGDWHDGRIPLNVTLHESAHIETSYSFHRFRSLHPQALIMGKASASYGGVMFDTGQHARIRLGAYTLLNGAWLVCDSEITLGDHCLVSWNVVIMDTYRLRTEPAAPVHIANNVWIGFGACILPGVTIGEGSVVGARSVVREPVPAYTLAAGNPARIRKHLVS